MESLLPTEVARLVYGYLMEENCERAAELFLETSVHLKECLLVYKKGRRFNTRVSRYKLIDILDILCETTCIVKAHSESRTSEVSAENVLQQLKTLLIPEEVRNIKYVKGRNDKSLPSIHHNEEYIQNDVSTIHNAEQDNSVSKKPNQEKKICNNDVERTENISHDLVHDPTSESKNDFSDRRVENRNSDEVTSSVQQIHSSCVNSSYLSVQCSDSVSKPDFITDKLETNHVNNSQTDVSVHISNISKTAHPILPELPSSVQQVPDTNPVLANNFNLQLQTPSKMNLSLNQSETIKASNHLLNVQQTVSSSYSINQPLIYIKTATIDRSQFLPNIFTSEHRPKSSSYREILETPSSSKVKNNQTTLVEISSHSSETPIKNNDNTLSEFLHFKTVSKDDASEIIRTGVRTRGGYRKRGGKVQRTVKAHLPKPSAQKDNKSNILPVVRENIIDQPSQSVAAIPVADSENSVKQSTEKIPDETLENTSIISKEDEKNDSEKKSVEKSDAATLRNLRKRGSLSVPRRGSHIRALEFKTPIKNLLNRRSLTSPKQLQSNSRSPGCKKSLRCVRVTLFKSPNSKKESKAWDADLRKCFTGNTDIPDSIGLKRNNNNSDKTPDQTKSTPAQSALETNNTLRNEDTNDVLADEIQKEVLSVIGEEDINLIGESTNLINGLVSNHSSAEKSDERQILNDNAKSPEPGSRLNNISTVEKNNTLPDLSSPNRSCFMTPVSKVLQEHRDILAHKLLTPGTPLNDMTIPKADSSSKLVSPSPNLISQDSLEASLINECKRIESENFHKSTAEKNLPSDNCKSESIFSTPEKLIKKQADCEFKLSTSDASRKSPAICSKQQNKNINSECDLQLNTSETAVNLQNISNDFQDVLNSNINASTPMKFSPPPSNNENKNNRIESNNRCKETCLDSKKQKFDVSQANQVLIQSNESSPSINNSKSTNSNEENLISPECYKISSECKTSLVKVKSKKYRQKYDIDCRKLIAECLQSAKENLYGIKKKGSSSPEPPSIQNFKTKHNVKLTKVKHSEKKNNYYLRSKSSRTHKDKFNSLLFSSDSEPSSSYKDSDVSDTQEEKHSNNNNTKENNDQIISASSPQNSGTDTDSIDFDDVFLVKCKRNAIDETSIKQKENLQKHFKKKTGNNSEEKSLAENDGIKTKDLDEQRVNLIDSPEEANSGRDSVDIASRNTNCHILDKDTISSSKSKESIEDSPKSNKDVAGNNRKFSDKLSNYTFTFALKLDGINVTKQLRVSPFYSVLEMESTNENPSFTSNLETKERNCSTNESDSEKKINKKRRRDYHTEKSSPEVVSNAKIDDKKSSPLKRPRRNSDHRYSSRSDKVKSHRHVDSRSIRSPVRFYNRHFRDYNTSRLRRLGTPRQRFSHFRRSDTGCTRKERYRNSELSRRSSYRTLDSSPETSRRSHNDRSDTKKSREDLKSRNQYKKHGGISISSSHLSSRSLKEKKIHDHDKEDGELSESSVSVYRSRPVERSSPSKNQRTITIQSSSSPVDADTRAILKKLNVDQFLSILHGKEK